MNRPLESNTTSVTRSFSLTVRVETTIAGKPAAFSV
jgi:hypothetical protein